MTIRKALSRHPLSFALTSALLAAVVSPAFAQEAGNEAGGKNATNLDRVSVVGSRIKRAEVEGPAPVTVISRADIDREGFQSVGDMLQTLTQNTTSSFTGDLAVTGFTPNAQVVNLRNLGPGYTLTLVNGRRPAQYPQPYNRDNNVVNIKAIPSSIVERVEVLTGGASAIYGSDAVAGVINIVLRKNYDGNQLRLTTGTTEEGGGDNVNVEYTGGKTGDRWSATYALQYSENEPVFASQRHALADTRNNAAGVAVNPSLSLVALSAGGLNGHVRNQNALYNADACDAFDYTTVTTPARGTYCGSYTQVAARSIWNKNQNFNGYGYGTFDVTDTTQLFGSVNFYKTKAKASGGIEFWGTSGDRFTSNPSGAATGVYYDSNLRDLIQLQRTFNPFELGGNEAASTLYDEKSYDITFGAQGTFADRFDWEASVNYGKYEYEADRPRLLAKAVHDYFLGPLQGYISNYPIYALNQDRWNTPITPEIYQSFATRVKNVAESTSATANFNVSGDLFELPAGPVGFAAVFEGIRQTTDLVSDVRTNQLRPIDDQTIYNLTSSGETHGARNRYAVGTEFRVPIFSNLSMNLAGRWDKYDDITAVDDAKTFNVGLEYRPFSNLLIRGSYATSFRAPDMQLVYAEGAASFSTILDEYSCRSGTGLGQAAGAPGRTRAQCNVTGDVTLYQAQSLIAGNPNLKEEEGKSWGAGFVWDIMDSMSMSVDYYKIRLEDASTQLSSTYLLQNEANCRLGVRPDGTPFEQGADSAFCRNLTALVTRTSAPGTTLDGRISQINTAYINAALLETSGIDATFKYKLDTDRLGDFGLDLGYSLVLTNKYQENSDDELIDYRDLPLYDYSQRSRVRGSLSWAGDEWGATLFGTRYGSNWNAAWTERLAPYMQYNLQISKKFGPNVRAEFTVVNLTDNQFRRDTTNTAYPYFNSFIGADPLGRRYYFSLSYRF
ncbi:TonB-dependent receptor [Stenotrophomonas sp. ESTM1D_MKCIP4_1]|uniref:TonB-dependent receptor domain-containing protein n=1 Tax=Stenotrophomonas sp. ESTM1D_MKCIP4_1 TaxID=2072414 RepID=UPI000D53E831|nr:TonB-dependent receptor [Stenotrophomonas sp. ESTM1D_MKCIP4_1]AWH54168.1 TonB-dependent receptor [Stenotrophomonas sp. ESTM1D_MKCIP4_1]